MRVIPTLAISALTTASALTIALPSAYAGDQPSFSASPNPAKPGDSVILSVSGGCDADSATASSDAFDGDVTLSTGSARVYTGTAKVSSTVQAGSYNVDVDCDGGTSTYSFTVSGAVVPTPMPTMPNPLPNRGVHAGVGGSQGGMDPAYIAGGVGLVSAAGGYAWLRSRRPREE
ncbi:hypothetical protein G3I40_12390 [Streptomyces sp. SID14478]|uniref:hypothetical protein n=1 Tax=Streptomyces sp. SID14478 TaxID=2706073 RepID=UPI0013D98FEB|nr:hypothetical protein [Streptomyces sp. SID14478]NEB76014.1 hypothetical protein [Streptomyces sp. SID14478]